MTARHGQAPPGARRARTVVLASSTTAPEKPPAVANEVMLRFVASASAVRGGRGIAGAQDRVRPSYQDQTHAG